MPEFWQEYAEAWLQGFDCETIAGNGKIKPISDQLETEVDEAAVEND
ncbi:hypothetical protein [Mesorhizobium sp. dw_380]|nr:hypothetical protein [Mesorhizobium sp. dw_380]